MALLDVSDVLNDPDLTDDFVVIRSAQLVDSFGRTQVTPGTYFTYGSVQPAKPTQLEQLPDDERVSSYISVVTQFPLFALTNTTSPDQVVWNNSNWRVVQVSDLTNYGNGFIKAICALESFASEGP